MGKIISTAFTQNHHPFQSCCYIIVVLSAACRSQFLWMNIAPTVSPQCRYGCLSACMDLKSWRWDYFIRGSWMLVLGEGHQGWWAFANCLWIQCTCAMFASVLCSELSFGNSSSIEVHNVGPLCWVWSSVWCFSVCEDSGSESWRAWSSCDFLCKASRLWSSIHFRRKI